MQNTGSIAVPPLHRTRKLHHPDNLATDQMGNGPATC